MKKLLLSVLAISAFAVISSVQSHNGCSRCSITKEMGCEPEPICEKLVPSRTCAIKECVRSCSFQCPAGFNAVGVKTEATSEFNDQEVVKASRRK